MPEPSRILIVDDDPVMRGVLQNALKTEGYVLETASNGKDALNKIPEFQPDLVLLDVMLPGMDGFAVCRQLRSDGRYGDLPVVFITSLDDPTSRLEGIEAGADEFLTKPVQPVELKARVKTITQLRRFRQLVGERSKFEKIIETAPQGILVVDGEGNIRLSNKTIRTLLGVEDETALRLHTIFHFVPREHRDLVNRHLEALLAPEAAPVGFELELRREDDSTFAAEVTAGFFPWESQPAVQLYVRNVEDKKQMERQFLRMQRLQSIGTLAGGIAHDLNNSLTPILVAAHLARPHVRETAAARLMETIEKSAVRGKEIIKNILSFARGVDGERRLVQLKYSIQEIEKIMRQTLPPSIEMTAEVCDNPSPVIGDVTQLHQVLMNLCLNARDAMPEGGALHLSLDNVFLDPATAARLEAPAAGVYMKLSVRDNGAGIPPDIVDKIFEPFFTTKPVGKGTGLGLSSAVGIIKSHGGLIQVTSEPGNGSCFDIYIPAASAGDATDEEYETTFIRRGKGEEILVIDDEPAICEMMEAGLKHYGYEVTTCPDAEQALERYRTRGERIRVVLVDYLLPGMNGGDAVDAMRGLRDSGGFILMTGYGEMRAVIDVAEEKGIRYLIKPFTVEALLEAIHRVLTGPAEGERQ